MTRRLPRTRHLLSADAYIHRATRGLPRAERLDAAAELRAHLLARMDEHRAQGFSPEEAEYLAVRGMGDPQPVNRDLLGHALTHRAGWLTLGALLVGGLGWTAHREWLPPREGAQFSTVTQQDVNALFSDRDAPRGTYQGVTLTYPRGTQAVLYVSVSSNDFKNGPEDVSARVKDLTQEELLAERGRLPGSYRYQERVLITPQAADCHGQKRVALFATGYSLPSPLSGIGLMGYMGTWDRVTTGGCITPSVRLHQVRQKLNSTPPSWQTRTILPQGEGNVYEQHLPLKLGEWRVLYRLRVDPEADPNTFGAADSGPFSTKARGAYLAVMPLDHVPDDSSGYSGGGMTVGFQGEKPIPLPPLVTSEFGQ